MEASPTITKQGKHVEEMRMKRQYRHSAWRKHKAGYSKETSLCHPHLKCSPSCTQAALYSKDRKNPSCLQGPCSCPPFHNSPASPMQLYLKPLVPSWSPVVKESLFRKLLWWNTSLPVHPAGLSLNAISVTSLTEHLSGLQCNIGVSLRQSAAEDRDYTHSLSPTSKAKAGTKSPFKYLLNNEH